ncbi:MAG: Ltp family lipoprotein [Candidatus Paceibacterota bacterium]|jgi:uncharacterized membrane protein
MSNDTQVVKEGAKNIAFGLGLSWVVSVLFIISGISALFSSFLVGILILLIGLIFFPPANKFIKTKWNLSLTRGVKITTVIILLILVGISWNPATQETTSSEQTKTQPSAAANHTIVTATTTSVVASQKDTKNILPLSNETVSQKNAAKKAKSYLNYTAFSYGGLVAQLEYDQFSHADAVYGADNSGANWNEQAAKKAKSYMGYSAFSRGGLITQLEFDKFTQSQAEYGANAAGL